MLNQNNLARKCRYKDGYNFQISICFGTPPVKVMGSRYCRQIVHLITILKLRAKKDVDLRPAGGLLHPTYYLVIETVEDFSEIPKTLAIF